MEEKFRDHCSSSSSKKSRFNFAIVSTLLASICFLTLRFSPSFLTLLLLIPSFLFLTYKKSDSNRHPLIGEERSYEDESSRNGGLGSSGDDFDKMPQRTAEERSAALIREERSSEDERSSNGGLGSSGDDFDHHLLGEMPQRTAEERSAALIGEERSSEDESSKNGRLGRGGDDFDHQLFDEMPQRTAEERSAALIGEERSSEGESSRNGGLGSSGDDFDHHLFDEMPQRTAEERSAALIGEETSSDDESSSNGGSGSNGDIDSDLWMCFDELARNPPFSDDSSSEDDDSLIEIPILPNRSAIRTDSNRESVRNLEMCLPDLLTDSALEEINEEDNLIEIDISRGFNRVCTACN